MAAPLQFTCVDSKMRPRITSYDTQDAAVAAGQAALLLVDDTAWGVVQILPGRALGSDNYDSFTDNGASANGAFFPPLDQVVPPDFNRSFFPVPFRYVKVGEIRFVSTGVVTFFPITPPDGKKRSDT